MVLPSKQVIDLGYSISRAEGFWNPDPSVVPRRAHNPGNLKLKGFPTTGEEGISVFPDDAFGWDRLYGELELIRDGNSQIYHPNMSFIQFARLWTDTQQGDWLNDVLLELRSLSYNIDGNTTLQAFFEMK